MSGWSAHSHVIAQAPVLQIPTPHLSDLNSNRSNRMELSEDEDTSPLSAPNEGAYFVRNGGAVFCTKDNLLNSVAYINQEFQLLGFPCLKYDGVKCHSDIVFFINRLYDLLHLYHKTLSVKEDLESRNHRLTCETDHHQSTNIRLKRVQEQSNKELGQEQEKFRQLNQKYKQVCSKLKSEKEEVKRLNAAIQSNDLQHKHEQKKKEREIHKLKERLHQLLSDKAPDRKVGMDLMNVVSRSEGRRATWKTGTGKQEEEMYQIMMDNYEDRHRQLMQENGELRDCLLSLQRELSALLKRTGDMSVSANVDLSTHSDVSTSYEEDGEENSVQSRLSISELNEGYFQMPFDIVRQNIEGTFKDTCNQITESMKKSLVINVSTGGHPSMTMSKSTGSNSSEKDSMVRRHSLKDSSEIERLKKQVHGYKAVIQRQEELIQQSLQSSSAEDTFLNESELLKEKENLSDQRKLFFEEKSNFEKERRAYTEAAIRLGKERQSLQEERAAFLKQHFLSISPFKENHPQKSKGDGQSSRLLPATPVFSPAKSSGKVSSTNLPSTEELYKALGLTPTSNKSSSDSTSVTKKGRRGSHSNKSTSDAFKPSQNTSVPSSSTANIKTTPASSTTPTASSPTEDAAVSLENIKASLLRWSSNRSKTDDS